MDYHKLCLDLFGTDDVNELERIARAYREKNPRKAGRKKKFTAEDVQTIRRLIENGMTVNQVAERFQTSRQIIGKYLNEKPVKGYTLRSTHARSLMWIFSIKESWFRIKRRMCFTVRLGSRKHLPGMTLRCF